MVFVVSPAWSVMCSVCVCFLHISPLISLYSPPYVSVCVFFSVFPFFDLCVSFSNSCRDICGVLYICSLTDVPLMLYSSKFSLLWLFMSVPLSLFWLLSFFSSLLLFIWFFLSLLVFVFYSWFWVFSNSCWSILVVFVFLLVSILSYDTSGDGLVFICVLEWALLHIICVYFISGSLCLLFLVFNCVFFLHFTDKIFCALYVLCVALMVLSISCTFFSFFFSSPVYINVLCGVWFSFMIFFMVCILCLRWEIMVFLFMDPINRSRSLGPCLSLFSSDIPVLSGFITIGRARCYSRAIFRWFFVFTHRGFCSRWAWIGFAVLTDL